MAYDIERSSERFRLKYEQFVRACEAAEAEGRWDTAERGGMEGCYFNIILGVLLHLIITDGNVAEREVESLNRNFGFDYTVESLLELYYSVGEEIEENYLANAEEGLSLLAGIDSALADDFRSLLALICEILAESDEGISEPELAALRKVAEKL